MSKFEKALDRLKKKPKDFTWKELQTIMFHLGYEEIKGGGSRRKFINRKTNVLEDVDKEYKGNFNVRIKPRIHRLVAVRSAALKVSLNQLVEKALEKEVADLVD